MSGYTIFTLVFPEPTDAPASVDESWPEPPGEPDDYGEKHGAYRDHGIDGRTVGVYTNSIARPASNGFLEQVVDRYDPQYVIVTQCSDTSDTAFSRLYAVFANGPQRVDEYGDGDASELLGDGVHSYFESEWDVRPWTVWDVWEGRGENGTSS